MKYTPLQLIKRILVYSRPYWAHIIALFVLTLLATPIALLKPLGMKIIIDSAFGTETLPDFITVLLPQNFVYTFQPVILIAVSLIILIALIDNINGYIIWVLSTYTGEKLVLNFRVLLFNHIQRLSLAYHDTKGASDSLYRVQWDTMCVRSLLLGQLYDTHIIIHYIVCDGRRHVRDQWIFCPDCSQCNSTAILPDRPAIQKSKKRLVQSKRC